MNAELVPPMRDTLFEYPLDNLEGTIVEYAEQGLDSILENNALKGIPIVGTVVAMCKTGASLRERNLLRQTAKFIISFNRGTIGQEKLEEHRRKLDDPKTAEKELGRVILLLDRTIEIEQSEVLGMFYRAYVAGSISWGKFVELSEVNSRMFLEDYRELWNVGKGILKQDNRVSSRRAYKFQRLTSLGLISESHAEVVDGTLVFPPNDGSRYSLTSLGKVFFSFMGER